MKGTWSVFEKGAGTTEASRGGSCCFETAALTDIIRFQESERKVNLLLSMCHMCNCFYLSCYQSSQHNNPQFVWVVPALRQLHEITRSFIKQTYQKQDKVRLYAEMIFEAFVVSV